MNVYDFDGTIYDGDSTVDFYLYCVKKHPSILRFFPKQCWGFLRYYLKRIDITRMKENFFCFLKAVDSEKILPDFWDLHEKNIFKWYYDNHLEDDIIISASPEFLLAPICERLGIKNMMASRVDSKTGKFASPNCRSEEKVKRLYEKYGKVHIDNFYSDSEKDLPLARLADKAFYIKKGEVTNWNLDIH